MVCHGERPGPAPAQCSHRDQSLQLRVCRDASRKLPRTPWRASVLHARRGRAGRTGRRARLLLASDRRPASSVKCQVSSVKCQVSSVKCQVPSAKCQVPSVKCQVPSVKCRVSSVKCQVPTVSSDLNGIFSRGLTSIEASADAVCRLLLLRQPSTMAVMTCVQVRVRVWVWVWVRARVRVRVSEGAGEGER